MSLTSSSDSPGSLLNVDQLRQVAQSKTWTGEDGFVRHVFRIVGQADIERVLELHDQLDQIQAVAIEIFNQSEPRVYFRSTDSQLHGRDIADARFDDFIPVEG